MCFYCRPIKFFLGFGYARKSKLYQFPISFLKEGNKYENRSEFSVGHDISGVF